MTTHPLISNATDSPSRITPVGEGLGRRVELVETVRSKLTKTQIEVTMCVTGVRTLECLKVEVEKVIYG